MQAVNSSHRKQAGRFIRSAGLFPFARHALTAALAALLFSGALHAAEAQGSRDQLILLENEPAAEAGDEDLAATIARLETELMLSEERLDRAQLEYQELSERLTMLDQQVALLRNVIEVEHERLAQLQMELAQQNEAAARAALERGSGLGDLFGANTGFLAGLGGLVIIVLGLLLMGNARRRKAVAEAEAFTLEPVAADEAETENVVARENRAVAEEASVAAEPAQQQVATSELEVNPEDLVFDDTMVFDDVEDEPAPEVNKIDLATAYMAMGNREGAQKLLDEVLVEGTPEQQEEARRLKVRWWASAYSQ